MRASHALCTALVSLGLASGDALAQDGNWNIANGPVGDFAVWAATSGVAPLTGDFNNDGRDDIALVRQTAGWGSVPIAFAQGNGTWNITNGPVGDFAVWAATSGVAPLIGDFNNDGRDDIALVRQTAGWGSVPIAFAQGNGTWNITNGPVGDFAVWAATSGVAPLTGDFNNDGRDDIALIRGTAGWGSAPIAFAQGNGTWSITNGPVGDFAVWAATSGVAPLIGDFNNDGRDDIALVRGTDGWGSVPIAFAQGNGIWSIANGPVGDFAVWAATSGVAPLTGDFNNDGRDDIALVRRSDGWGSVPIAFAQGNGTWNVTNGPVGDFAGWAATSGVAPLTGDFNNDGRDDIALIRRSDGWGSVPIAFAQGNGTWSIANGPVGDFAGWAATSGVTPLTGDFNNDGRDDIALVRRSDGWGSVPIAFATNVSPITTRQLTISRHNTATLTNAEVDAILADASTALQVSDGPDDVACPVALVRSGNVGVFNTGDGSLDTAAELSAVFNLPGNVKVVDDVNFCANQFNTSYIGCGQTPGTSFITERFTANQEGILWAHEFGHNQGLPHRDTSTNNVMYFSIGTNRRRINQAECNALLGQQGQIAAAGQIVLAQASTQSGARVPVEEFVTQIYFHGLPLDQAATYGAEDVEILIGMLNDPSMAQYHENIALTLGMIGDARAVEPLIAHIREGAAGGEAAMSRAAYRGRVGAVVALGYLVNRSGSEEALSFLLESTSPDMWVRRDIPDLGASEMSLTETTRDLSKYAIIALGLSGNPTAAEHLRSLRDQAGPADERSFRTEVSDVVTQSLEMNEEISREGLLNYYKSAEQ